MPLASLIAPLAAAARGSVDPASSIDAPECLGRVRVVLAADADRPASEGVRSALAAACSRLSRSVARVELEHWDRRLGAVGCATVLVLDGQGEVCGRLDGELDEGRMERWLAAALRLANESTDARSSWESRVRFADRLLSLGATERARAEFERVAKLLPESSRAGVDERLARIALLSGDVSRASDLLRDLARDPEPSPRLLHTLGLWCFARRELSRACEFLARAAPLLEDVGDPESPTARLDWARVAVAEGESSLALQVLAPLLSPRAVSDPMRAAFHAPARRLADSILAPSPSPELR